MGQRAKINHAVDVTLMMAGDEDTPLNRLTVLQAMWDEGEDGAPKTVDQIIYWTMLRQEIHKQKLEVIKTEKVKV